MNPFTKGAKVRAVRDTKSYGAGTPIPEGTVLEVARTNEVDAAALFNAVRPDGGEYAVAKDDFTPAPSLPTQHGDDDGREAAPLDPKSVHVGDTVTVRFKETGDEIVTKAYQPDDITRSGEWVYLLGFPLHRPDGTFGLAFSYFEILAIEPAPKPRREWKPGTVGTAGTVRGLGYTGPVVRSDDGPMVWWTASAVAGAHWHREDDITDFVPDEPRPLPTRDDLARIMHDDYLPNGSPRLGRTAREELAAAVLRFLRGEVR